MCTIALAVLAALDFVPPSSVRSLLVAAELALDGRLKPIQGALPAALAAARASQAP